MTRVGLAGVAVVSAVLLSGCGGSSGFNPGVAARVDDDVVSTQRVADLAVDYCAAAEPQLQGQALPNYYLNGRVAGSLALRSAADQMLAQYGVAADPSYAKAVKQVEQQLADSDPAQRDAIIEVEGAESYVAAAEVSVGRQVLDGASTEKAAQEAGKKAFLAWIDDHDVQINPRYGVSIADGSAAAADTSLSFAVSKTATNASGASPDTEYAAGLPSTQRCG